MANYDIDRISRRLHTIERNIAGLSTPQLIHSSIEDGSVEEYDADGNLVAVLGKQFDGTHGAVAFQGPRPPTPTTPTAEGGPGTLTAVWDGGFTGGAARPLDLHFVRATAVNTATGESSPMGTTVASGPLVASLPPGTYEVTLSAESMPGLTSRYPSAAATAVVTELVDQQAITDELAAADQRLTAARTALEQADQDLSTALAGTEQAVAAVPGKIATAKQEAIDAPTKLEQLVVGQNVIPSQVVDELFARVVKARTVTATEAFIGGSAILDGAITARTITASDALWAKIGQFVLVESNQIRTNALDGKLITAPIIRTAATGARGLFDTAGYHAFNAQNVETVRLDGVNNLVTGQLNTNTPGEPGIILVPTTSTGKPGVWFSQSGSTSNNEAAIYVDSDWNLSLRGNRKPDGTRRGVTLEGLTTAEGMISRVPYAWLITTDGLGLFTRAIIGNTATSTRHVEFDADFAGMYFRTSGGLAPSGSDGAISVPNGNSPVEIRGPLDFTGSRQGLKIISGKLDLEGAPTSTFSANMGIASNNRVYKLTSNAKYKAAIQPQTLATARKLLDVAPVTWFDRFQAEAYADHMAGVGPALEDIPVLRRIPGVTAQDVAAAGLHEYVTYDAAGEMEGVAYDRLWTLLILLVKNLYTEREGN